MQVRAVASFQDIHNFEVLQHIPRGLSEIGVGWGWGKEEKKMSWKIRSSKKKKRKRKHNLK
jgi:hypothetical protein